MESQHQSETRTGLEIAVVGMAGRFPGANRVAQFWDAILAKRETISFFSAQELRDEGIPAELVADPNYVRAAGILDGKEYFDPHFFGYSPNEAKLMDPQLRIFHECVWEALEHAGCNPLSFAGRIGLYAGCSPNFGWELLVRESGLRSVVGDYTASLFSDKDALAQHVSYRLNLRGPSVNIQTACSTSLVAVHLASQGLLSGDCEVALAGGISASCLRKSGYLFREGMILSPDGHCRAFDAQAAGTVFGEGAGVVVLKPLAAALRDRDHIYAIIRSSAVNNDGGSKVGYTATSLHAQVDVIRTAHLAAGIDAADISFIEAHGSATPLGDPIEIEALRRAFASRPQGECALGSVKTNVGHLNRAAGVTGLIKAVMALHERVLPPQLHFQRPNPAIEPTASPFHIATETITLTRPSPLLAGVSSFGIGGTNAHVVLEEPPRDDSQSGNTPQLIPLSAKTGPALEVMTTRLVEFIRDAPQTPPLADVARTLQEGRAAFEHRRALVAASPRELIELAESRQFLDGTADAAPGPLVFLFPGQGAQYRNMGRELYTRFSNYREIVETCLSIFRNTAGWDLGHYLYPGGDPTPSRAGLADMRVLQPAVFVLEYSLARFLMQMGLEPRAMIGYSFGEYAAACLAGVFQLEDALALAAFRGELMQRLPEGRMLSVPLPEKEVAPLLHAELSLAAANGPACVISGTPEAVADFEKRMQSQGLICMPVQTRYAAHAQMPRHMQTELEGRIRAMRPAAPERPYVSSLTGAWITPDEAQSADYWVRHLTSPVRFYEGLVTLTAEPGSIFLEVGPGRDLTLLAGRIVNRELHQRCLHLIHPADHGPTDEAFFLGQLGRLWLRGYPLRWERAYSDAVARKTPLPTYPFERQAYWPETGVYETYAQLKGGSPPAARLPLETWGYVASWQRKGLAAGGQSATLKRSLSVIFMDEGRLGRRLARALARDGVRVVSVGIGPAFCAASPDDLTINPETQADYVEVFKRLGDEPCTVIHLWNMEASGTVRNLDWEYFVGEQKKGYFSLLFIARALGDLDLSEGTELFVISTDLQNVSGAEPTRIEKAPLLAAVHVIPKEFPGISCMSIDVPRGSADDSVRHILAELAQPEPATEVAYRGPARWTRTFTAVALSPESSARSLLREGAAYLITGGLGDLGLVVARSLAERTQLKLLLTGRSFFPSRKDWTLWVDTKGPDDPVSRKIGRLQEIEALGSTVLTGQADCADYASMQVFLAACAVEAGPIQGVVHAAGVIDGALIQRRSVDACLEVMKPKIKGLFVLESLLPSAALDFFVTFSSIGAVIPSAGQVAYCAANLFLDRWAVERSAFGNVAAKSIGWDIWSEVGMGERSWRRMKEDGQVDALVKAKELALRDGIRNHEGAAIFHRVLSQAEPHVIVSTRPLTTPIGSGERARPGPVLSQAEWRPVTSAPPPRTGRRAAWVAPETASEKRIGRIWEAYFGLEEVGLHDDFFELGGDSLKAGVVLNRIREGLNVAVSLAAFYEHSRLDRLAALVDKSQRTEHATIPRTPKADHYDVSHAQLRLWFLNEFGGSGFAYNRSSVLSLKGSFDPDLYCRCFQSLIERHESLRTSFVLVDGVPSQKVQADQPFALLQDDLSTSPDLTAEIQTRLHEELHFTFDLKRPPLFRARILKLAEDDHISIFTIHHIVCDEWSVHLLHKELARLYNARMEEVPALAPLSLQYKDYVAWNKRAAASEEHRAFWLGLLSGELPRTTVPPDKVRPAEKTYIGATVSGKFPPAVAAALRELGRDANASLFMVLAALVETLLYLYTSDEDILIGTAVAGRDHVQLENLIGFFVNTLPLRYQLRSDQTFAELLAVTRKTMLAAYEHQSYPFDKIVEDLRLPRDPSWNPLFEIMLLFHNEPEPVAPFRGLATEPMTFPVQSSLFDLTFNFRTGPDTVQFSLEYNTDLYGEDKIRQIVEHLVHLADSITGAPGRPLKSLSLVPAGEEGRPVLSNGTAPDINPDASLTERFEQCVDRQPDDVALVFNGKTLTYRELNERVNQTANYLSTRFHPMPDDRIGVCLERSGDLVVALLAVLKAGGAYVPIDPGYPPNRIENILRDSGAVALLIDETNTRLAGLGGLLPVVSVGEAQSPSCANPLARARSHHLAYVTYTSGSTGHPKGVMIEHRNVLNYLHNCAAVFGIGPGDTVYGLTAVTFDIAVMELVCSQLIGCRLVIEEAVHDMDAIAARIRDERVSVLQMTPSRLHAYLERNAVTTLASVRVMLVGGEPLTPMLLGELRKLDRTRVFHVYGPTETTVWSSASLISGAPVSLGRPLAGEEIFILSRDAKLMPRGLPGEICIAGEGVGRGYLNRPELTVQQFISVPFLPRKRVYRTGDLGCIALDGELSFLGRNDSQVKIQGVRVEIGEIENQLLRHGGVTDAAVLACDKKGGGKALWACVVSDVGEAALRRYLGDSFPYYMIPEVFVFLESLPLTVNGKTDRQALMKVASSFIPPPHGSREPTLVERQLMEFWRAALKLPAQPGTGDNFFALGGNSLKAAQVIGQIQAVFGVVLELRDFFTGPTIEEIGQLIEAIAWSASGGNGAPDADETFII